MLIELLKAGEFKVGESKNNQHEDYKLLLNQADLTITIQLYTAPLATFPGTNQGNKVIAQQAKFDEMKSKFIQECTVNYKIPFKPEDIITQDAPNSKTLIIKRQGVDKLIDKLYEDHKNEVFAEALFFIRELLSKDKTKIREAILDVDFLDYTIEQGDWDYITFSLEIDDMANIASYVARALSKGIIYLLDEKEENVQTYIYDNDKLNEPKIRNVVRLNPTTYNKFAALYVTQEEELPATQVDEKTFVAAQPSVTSLQPPAPIPAATTTPVKTTVAQKRPVSRYSPAKPAAPNHSTHAADAKKIELAAKKPAAPVPLPRTEETNIQKPAAPTLSQDNHAQPSALVPLPRSGNSNQEHIMQSSAMSAPPSLARRGELNVVVDLQSAKKYLDEHLYNQNTQYQFKKVYLDLIMSIFMRVCTKRGDADQRDITTELCDLFDYINEKNRKNKINLHKHPWYDAFFSKNNTQQWITCIRQIRNATCDQLIGLASEKFPGNPNGQAAFIARYRDRKLFTKHLDNTIFNDFHDTKTAQRIEEQISMRTIKNN
jgi:hypothetical protein